MQKWVFGGWGERAIKDPVRSQPNLRRLLHGDWDLRMKLS